MTQRIFTFAFAVGFLALVSFAFDLTVWGRDDTDPPGSYSRMGLRTDNLTGCQYLTTFFGITPRMDSTGKQVCK